MINTKNINEARKQIQKLKKEKKKIIVQAQESEFNRKIIENKDVDIFLDPHIHKRKSPLKQKDSGLNEILCKIAKKNNIKIGLTLSKIKSSKNKSIVLARVMQNIRLCKKTGTEIILLGRYDKKDAFSFLLSLGCSTSQAKKAIAA